MSNVKGNRASEVLAAIVENGYRPLIFEGAFARLVRNQNSSEYAVLSVMNFNDDGGFWISNHHGSRVNYADMPDEIRLSLPALQNGDGSTVYTEEIVQQLIDVLPEVCQQRLRLR